MALNLIKAVKRFKEEFEEMQESIVPEKKEE